MSLKFVVSELSSPAGVALGHPLGASGARILGKPCSTP
ncbi:MAG: hypothetical protein FI703_03580 [SAR202 cluster bacterium]|nr:hypothetical protein [SAR202 cluster bacterium]